MQSFIEFLQLCCNLNFSSRQLLSIDPVLSVVKDVVGQFDERVANVLPGKSEEINVFKEKILNPDDIARHLADKSVLQRSIDWIKTEGKCIDNLVPQISTLPDAGELKFHVRVTILGS